MLPMYLWDFVLFIRLVWRVTVGFRFTLAFLRMSTYSEQMVVVWSCFYMIWILREGSFVVNRVNINQLDEEFNLLNQLEFRSYTDDGKVTN